MDNILARKLLEAGISNKQFSFGDIFLCNDDKLVFPDEELYGREKHDERPVLILQDSYYNNNPLFKTITIAPISTKCRFKTDLDIELMKSIDGVQSDSYVRLYLIQPILKTNLLKYVNRISKDKIDELKAILIFHFGFSSQNS